MIGLLPAAAAPWLYLLVATGALLLARRSRLGLSWPAAAVLALLPTVVVGGALVRGDFFGPADLVYAHPPLDGYAEELGVEVGSRTRYDIRTQILPMYEGVRYALAHGQWPLLNPFVFSGQILAPAGQPAAYHPVYLLSYLLPIAAGWTFKIALGFFLGGVGAFLFARASTFDEGPALLAAAGWELCELLIFFTGWPIGFTVGFLPFVLLATRAVVRRPSLASGCGLAGALVLVLVAGHPESLPHVLGVGAAYGLYELIVAHREAPRPVRSRRRRTAIAMALLAGVVALGVAAVDLLPTASSLVETREYAQRAAHGTGDPVPWSEIVRRSRVLLLPFAYGHATGDWVKPKGWSAAFHPGVGSVLVPLAIYGLLWSGWRARWLFLGIGLVGTLAFLQAPGVTDLLNRIPMLDILNNKRLSLAAALAVALLAAAGLQAWNERRDQRLAGLYLGWLVLVVALARLWREDFVAYGLSEAFLTRRTAMEAIPLLLAAVLTLWRPRRDVVAAGLLCLLVGQREAQTRGLDGSFDEAVFYPRIPEVALLRDPGEPFRVVGFRNALPAGASPLYELEDPRGVDALRHAGYVGLYRLWTDRTFWGYQEGRVDDLSLPFLDFLNVRYAYVARGSARPDPSWTRVLRGRTADVFENGEVLPRAFLPRRVETDLDAATTVRAMTRATDFADLAWIDVSPEEGRARGPVRNGRGRVAVERVGTELRLDAAMEEPGWVVVSQTAWKGWRAWIDDDEIPVRTANLAFLALELPEGSQRVRLRYRPRAFVRGRWITAASLAVLGLLAFFAGRKRRTRPWGPGGSG